MQIEAGRCFQAEHRSRAKEWSDGILHKLTCYEIALALYFNIQTSVLSM